MVTLDTSRITPELLPLVDITQGDIDLIMDQVEGEVANIQDIYALSPLQDGILFHHIMATKGDPYLCAVRMSFDNKDILDRYLHAVQIVIDRHDILRTAIIWENLSAPVQVVLRHAKLSVTELSLDPKNGPIAEQMARTTDPQEHRIDLTQAPLIRFIIAQDTDGTWVAVELMHHLICDNSTMAVMGMEIQTILNDQAQSLLEPQPFRNLIAQVRSSSSVEVHERFFTKMLAEIDTPALPYGLSDVHGDGLDVTESHITLPQDLNDRIRGHAMRMGVSLAALCHLAWAQVISKTSRQEQVVFGTVLSGRMQGGLGFDQVMGLFINTLPLRIDVGGSSVEQSVRQTQADLAALLEHEYASLALAQRCSNVPAGTPLFSSLLNYRHKIAPMNQTSDIVGMKVVGEQGRTNYPFTVSVEDGGHSLGLTAQVVKQFDSSRICLYMQQALQSLVEALDHSPNTSVRSLEILPAMERQIQLKSWNALVETYPDHLCIHHLFENQVKQSPDAIAVVYENQEMSYRELNARANSLAYHLIDLGVKPDSLVAICVGRSTAMVVALLAVLKAGGAYVPLDPTFASERLHDILADASPAILLADESGIAVFGSSPSPTMHVVDPNVVLSESTSNPYVSSLMPHHLAYIIYTSGSTGKPKGVMIEHRNITNLAMSLPSIFGTGPSSKVIQFFSFSFDGSILEIFSAICLGGSLHILPDHIRHDQSQLWKYMDEHFITQATLTPTVLQHCERLPPLKAPLNLVLAGEAVLPTLLQTLRQLIPYGSVFNGYGPTETTVSAIGWKCPDDFSGDIAPVGQPNPNKR
ncbi:hypothetical protein BGX26_005991, partial [Mortierella sp. AD094]